MERSGQSAILAREIHESHTRIFCTVTEQFAVAYSSLYACFTSRLFTIHIGTDTALNRRYMIL